MSMKPLATSAPPMKVRRWRRSASVAAFMIGSFGVFSGLRLRNSFICLAICVGCNLRCTAHPSRGRNALRRVWAKFDSSPSASARCLPIERQRTKPWGFVR